MTHVRAKQTLVERFEQMLDESPHGLLIDALDRKGLDSDFMSDRAKELATCEDPKVRLATLIWLTRVRGAFAPVRIMSLSQTYEASLSELPED